MSSRYQQAGPLTTVDEYIWAQARRPQLWALGFLAAFLAIIFIVVVSVY